MDNLLDSVGNCAFSNCVLKTSFYLSKANVTTIRNNKRSGLSAHRLIEQPSNATKHPIVFTALEAWIMNNSEENGRLKGKTHYFHSKYTAMYLPNMDTQ